MNKILTISLAGSLFLSSFAFGADFSQKTNDELINLSGVVSPNEVLDYKKEIEKRLDDMTRKDGMAFREKLRAQEEKVYGEMKVKDLKARKEAIFNAIKEQCQKDPNACPKPKGDRGGRPNGPGDDMQGPNGPGGDGPCACGFGGDKPKGDKPSGDKFGGTGKLDKSNADSKK